jgi:hypothetical protein
MKRLVLIAPLIALAVACGQQPKVEIGNPTQLGTVDLALGGQLKTQATYISDETQIAITPLAGGYISDTKRNVKYIWGRFQVKNTTGAALSNLTFYALNKSGNNGGTAIKSMTNFVGAPTADDAAQAAQPGHAMLPGTGAGAATIDTANANLQLFTASEVSALGVPAGTGTVLEYGYKVNAASIPDGDTSVVTLSYKIPFASTSTSFTATFAIAKDGPDRVSQSADESAAAVNARAASVTEVAYVGPRAANTTQVVPPANVTNTLRFANPKTATGTTNAFLLNEYVYASFLDGSSINEGGYGYGFGYNAPEGYAGCTPSIGCTFTYNNITDVASGTLQTAQVPAIPPATGVVDGDAGFGIALAPFTNGNTRLSQDLSKYKKLKIFTRTSYGTNVDIAIDSPNGELEYAKTINNTLTEYELDLTQPKCLPNCNTATILSRLSTANNIVVKNFIGKNATGTTEVGRVVYFDYQP